MIPPARRGGRPRDVNVREVLNAISTCSQLAASGRRCRRICRRRAQRTITSCCGTGTARFHHRLYVAAREQAGHEASPTAAIIDSQTSKAAQKGALRLTHRASMLPKSPGPAKVVYRALFGFVLPNSTRCCSYNNPFPHPTGEYGPPP